MGQFTLRGPPDHLRRVRRRRPAAGADPRPADEPPHVRPAGAGDGHARQPGDLRRPARPRRLRPARGPARSTRCRCSRDQVVALLDHLELETGRSSAAPRWAPTSRSSSPTATRDRAEALFIEMPVLDNALAAVAAIFAPILLALRFGTPGLARCSRGVTSLIPRTTYLVDIGLDWVAPAARALAGGARGPAPRRDRAAREERAQIDPAGLIIGHPDDPLHPFSDSGMLAEELRERTPASRPNSILEWRISPERLDDELRRLPRRRRTRPRPRAAPPADPAACPAPVLEVSEGCPLAAPPSAKEERERLRADRPEAEKREAARRAAAARRSATSSAGIARPWR